MQTEFAEKDVDVRVLNSTSFSKMTKEILGENKQNSHTKK